jgi:hypothetical protein
VRECTAVFLIFQQLVMLFWSQVVEPQNITASSTKFDFWTALIIQNPKSSFFFGHNSSDKEE